ncbi:MAG: 1-(5-phosphoribosyl)-5-[(5-phosphoribosylamino)methylideneamino] imidazole-4-carboxamide isomerase [Acidobacteria bacterium]|nr:1-(5-phosphoribosyl)-5-[(5-phosphoribosylamino)methylideneamino] imidazole-4-carboxamide isomerase [Acidobacteriota bacterium]MBV9625301.1 1-(5-phosphoribosyl)-5-[(5-phosphoribosylamino)methylideneamino] imidazole-4-carboxamide isomerase [Acidobacteriota bacterium]
MLIPSVDLMDGKIVQLVQGRKKALEFNNFAEWITRFSIFPLVQLIDLDAAIGRGMNTSLMGPFLRQLPCQVGGGIRSIEAVRTILERGARRVILGSALIRDGKIDVAFARRLAAEFGPDKLVFAVDARRGRVAIRGWRKSTAIPPVALVRTLDSWCGAFLYTHIDSEGLMAGIPLKPVLELRRATSKQLIVAGGISSREEIDRLHTMGVDAVVGMAVYSGQLPLVDPFTVSK